MSEPKEEPMSDEYREGPDRDALVDEPMLAETSRSRNPMASLDQAKENEAAANAASILQMMEAGGDMDFGGPEEEEDVGPTPAKQIRHDSMLMHQYTQDDFRQRMQKQTIDTHGENCTHEVVYPPDVEYVPLKKFDREPAKHYEFKLDPFQSEAIKCIENNQSVLVSAHTSAGKTVVALYAIAQCLRDKQKVIYTSPIKALSNQKYRELEEEFGDVGLMTGDVTLNPDASCIVMTTEILRSMLYKGSEMMREVGYVVFDEIHYMRDKERGVVWEESIIMLQPNVHHVFLSATIPNACQFAQWVSWLHHVPVHVVYTDYRPTPLQHFIFPAGGDGLYEVVNVKGDFRDDKFNQAMQGLSETKDTRKPRGTSGDSNVTKIIRTIKEREMLPCIIFSFSRKECENYAMSLKDMDFNTEEEKDAIDEIYKNAITMLSDADRQLPQIKSLPPLLKRGIGVHHSGLLPIIKEVIEILFGESLIKTLFATETFSMGLNMPARTVLFTSARKFDGKNHRWLTSGEYIQMSGRAGRRGLDDKGLVILMVDAKMSSDDAKQIIKGKTDPLNSQFRLTYNMILNLVRVDGWNPSHMMERSFHQFQSQDRLPELQQKVADKQTELRQMKVDREDDIEGVVNLENRIAAFEKTISEYARMPKYLVPFLHVGRLLKIIAGHRNFGWGVLCNFNRMQNPENPSELIYSLHVLIPIDPASARPNQDHSPTSIMPPAKGTQPVWEIIPMLPECIDKVGAIRVKIAQDMGNPATRRACGQLVEKVLAQFNDEPVVLDPKDDMRIPDEELRHAVDKRNELVKRKDEHPLLKLRDYAAIRQKFEEKQAVKAEMADLNKQINEITRITKHDELENRMRVLRRLTYIDQNDVITKKGQVACEISASDELMLTEMLFHDVFQTLSVEQLVALLSCFVFQENAPTNKMADELSGCLRKIHEFARNIAKISNECKVEIIEDDYVNSFKPGLMDVVYNWASGLAFAEIMKKTEIFEGSIIRCLRRLEEVLRELMAAAQGMSNQELQKKLEEARAKIKRDIVFAASLYL